MEKPSKEAMRSDEPQTSSNISRSRGSVRTCHISRDCPDPYPHTMPYWLGSSRRQLDGSPRLAPTRAPSTKAQKSSRAWLSSDAFAAPRSTTYPSRRR